MMEYLARYGKASQKYRRNGKMQRQKRRILQKITAAVLSAALAVGMVQGGVPGRVLAQEGFSAAAQANDNETWNEDSAISTMTISGGTESDPKVITVTGNVTVSGKLTISGHVKFTGGGVLKWSSERNTALEVAEGASAVFENVTLDGDNTYFSYSALLFRGTVEFGAGTTIQNFESGTTGNAVPGHKGVIAVCDKGVLNIKEGTVITKNTCYSGIISLYQTDDRGYSMPITAEVNIEGGRIEGNTVNNQDLGVVWNWFGNLKITGGTVTASANEYAVYTQGNEDRYAGTTEIYGGTFTGEKLGAVCSGKDPGNKKSKIIIAGGVFKGNNAARVNYGTIDVRGGKYEGSQYALMSSTGEGSLTVQGGEFLGGIAAYKGNITTKTNKVVVGESADSAVDWDKSTSLNSYKYVAIGDRDNAYVHTHTRKKHESTATCTEPGTGEYWQCEGEDGCGKLFSEDNDRTEINRVPEKEATNCALEESVWKSDKDTHWHQCICGTNKSQAEAHIFESEGADKQVCSVCGYTDGAGSAVIEDVENKIKEIASETEYTQEWAQKVEAAQEAYNALTEEEKAGVSAEMRQNLESAKKKYDDWKAAQEVKNQIEEIGEVTAGNVSGKKEQIESAREAYDSLTEEQKKLITPEDKKKLTDAEKAYDDATGGKNQAAADAVKEKIDQIPGPVTPDGETGKKIEDAKEAYDSLTTTQKDMLPEDSRKKLEEAQEEYESQKEADRLAADAVKEKIEAIGGVTPENVSDKKDFIEEARKAYDSLTDKQKELITPEDKKKLTDAEKMYDDATGGKNQAAADAVKEKIEQIPSPVTSDEETGKKIEDAKEAYENLTGTQKDMVSEEDKKKLEDAKDAYDNLQADKVKDKIDAIGEVTLENAADKKQEIEDARDAYDKLTDDQKELITPEEKKELTDAEYIYDQTQNGKNKEAADKVVEKIDAIPEPVQKNEDCRTKIEDAKNAYDSLTGTQKDMVPESSKKKLENAQNTYDRLAVGEVMEKIDAIGELTLENAVSKKDLIDDAREAYDKLTDKQKEYITPEEKKKLTDAEKIYDNATGGHNQAAADNVVEKIDAIPNPVENNADTKQKIEDARESYDKLTTTQKDMVPESSKKKLENAEEEYQKLLENGGNVVDEVKKKIDAVGEVTSENVISKKNLIEDAREAYDKLTDEQKELIEPEEKKKLTDAEKIYDNATGGHNQAAADKAKEKIDAIPGPVRNDEETRQKIEDAREAYDDLSGTQKDMLPEESKKKLEESKTAFDKLVTDDVKNKIDAIGEVTPENVIHKKDLIEDAREAYDKLTDSQKEMIDASEVKKLTDAEKIYGDVMNEDNQTKLDQAAVQNVVNKINAIGTVVKTDECAAKIKDARAAYDALTDIQKKLVPEAVLKILTDAESAYAALTKETNLPADKQEQIDHIAEKLGVSKETAEKIQTIAEELGIDPETLLLTDRNFAGSNSESDIKGSEFAKLQAKAVKTQTKKVTLKWKKIKGADGYLVYGVRCGKGKLKLLKNIKKSSQTTYTQTKLKKGKPYRYLIRAYKMIDGKRITISASKMIHVFTEGGKFGNSKSIKLKKSKATVKKGKTFKVSAKEIKKKKPLRKHRALSFESSNKKVATVTKKGVIKGKSKGTCFIYVYAQNGIFKKIKVTVK